MSEQKKLKLEQDLEKLLQKVEAKKQQLKVTQAKTEESKRKEEESRKFKVGAYFLHRYRALDKYDELCQIMDKFLVHDSARKLFDLKPKSLSKEQLKSARFDYEKDDIVLE